MLIHCSPVGKVEAAFVCHLEPKLANSVNLQGRNDFVSLPAAPWDWGSRWRVWSTNNVCTLKTLDFRATYKQRKKVSKVSLWLSHFFVKEGRTQILVPWLYITYIVVCVWCVVCGVWLWWVRVCVWCRPHFFYYIPLSLAPPKRSNQIFHTLMQTYKGSPKKNIKNKGCVACAAVSDNFMLFTFSLSVWTRKEITM